MSYWTTRARGYGTSFMALNRPQKSYVDTYSYISNKGAETTYDSFSYPLDTAKPDFGTTVGGIFSSNIENQ